MAAVITAALGTVAWADHVNPVVYGDEDGEENNPSCKFLDPAWSELKVNQAPNGTYQDGTLTFTIKKSDGKTFEWESNIGIDALVVKGGNRGSNVYFYDPEATADKGVRSPDNTQGNTPAVSHVSVCYDAGDEQQDQPPQQEPPQEGPEEEEPPRDEGDNERPSEPDEPDEPSEPGQPEGEEDEQDSNERPAEPDEPQEEDTEEPEREERQADEPENQDGGETEGEGEGEGGVEGVSETDAGETDDDVAEETESGSDDDSDDNLPFTGAPLGGLLLIGILSLLTGAAGRAATRR